MLRQFSNFVWLKPQILQLVRQQSTATANKSVNKVKWDLLVGIQIERLPIISKTLSKLEQQYQVSYQRDAARKMTKQTLFLTLFI